jgi:hypothetical protein
MRLPEAAWKALATTNVDARAQVLTIRKLAANFFAAKKYFVFIIVSSSALVLQFIKSIFMVILHSQTFLGRTLFGWNT